MKKINQGRMKRPLNAFMLWSKVERRRLLDQNPNLNYRDASKLLSTTWKQMNAEEKRPYMLEHKRLKVLYCQQNSQFK